MDKATMRGGTWKAVSGDKEVEIMEPMKPEPEDALEGLADHPPEPDPEIMEHMDGSITIQLTHPMRPHQGKGADIALGINKIVLRELYAGDIVEMDRAEGDFSKIKAVVAELSGMPAALLDRLHSEDYAKLHGVVSQKLGNFLMASAKASSLLLKR